MSPRKKFLRYVILAAVAVVSFQCSDDDDSPPEDPKSTEKSITSFKFAGLTPTVTATINEAGKTIAATLPAGTNVTALVPTIEISEDAGVSPTSGTAQNFSTPVTYTVTAEDGSKQTYTVTVTVEEEEIVCYPTELPGPYTIKASITYNTDNTVATVIYTEDEVETNRSEFEYTNGKHSRTDDYRNDVLYSYTTYTYGTNTITVTFYPADNDFEATYYYIYYLDGDRITGYGRHSMNNGGERTDSAVYTYTNDNLTQLDGYGAGEVVVWDYAFEYDDKPNPHALVGLTGYQYEYFGPLSLSKNNPTRFVFNDPDFENETQTNVYTYNDDGLPLTRSHDGEPALSYTYDCR
jgi:hypothetical protein